MSDALRRSLVSNGALGLAYFLAAAGAIAATRYEGGVAFLWVATAILTARLTSQPRRLWPTSLAICFVGNVIATSLWGLGPMSALPLGLVNVAEATIGATILRITVGRRPVLDSHRWLIGFVVATGIVAPALGAIGGAGIATLLLAKPFLTNALHWYTGHALGTVAFMPIAMMVMRGDIARIVRASRHAKLVEQAFLLMLVAGCSTITFAQDGLPILFLPLLPIVLATFRGSAVTTAASIVILTLIGGYFTLDGHGPIGLMQAGIGTRMQFLQFYIATTMLTILPANAELERRAELYLRLRASEARYRLLTDNSTDVVVNLDPAGRILFISPSIRAIVGIGPEALLGRPLDELVDPRDHAGLAAVRLATMANPDGSTVHEFRALSSDNSPVRWLEAHSRAVLDGDGSIDGVVSAIRDVTARRANEERLAQAAMTDPLTGLANRRAFREALARHIDQSAPGCVALFDLDHFKRVNDRYGHAAGDQVLRRFGAIARSCVREEDVVARIGGEEFAVLLPGITLERARVVCDRLRIAIAADCFETDNAKVYVTVSGGVAAIDPHMNGDAALQAADGALYRAKAAGRDQLALAV